MTLFRCWAVGIVVLVVAEYVQMTLVYDPLVGPEGVGSFGAALALVHLPNLACVVLATWAAARVHPEPWREMPVRHLAAACVVGTGRREDATAGNAWSNAVGPHVHGLP
ncbi:hypothetical protein [Streptomyces lomondensis]|uniref:Uncharacterized protein n=1 Tax=Streptomyces lomondensis TaxID=68229 RepID=A0ABQ2X099_9ACTN|nr:hypothetical protein [Streptomyces lomondensis]MCF0076075.1 hypothetical protein [Streptomyces lomondensis]GGW88962.1 hypothetical protein GCM10010383_17780 [Streptomyces lomondensis]